MPDILYGKGAYRRDNGNFPEFKLINMLVEPTAASEDGVSLLSFPGLTSTATRGTGPIRGIFRKAGLFNGSVFTISNNTLYKDGTSLGTVAGSGPVSWAASDEELVVTRGGSAYSYNGTNLVAVSFPDGASVTAVAYIGGLFVYVRAGTLGARFYWSAVLDGRTIDALDYATAESAPDKLRDVVAIGDNIFLLGEDTIEVWLITGALALPFSRISQRTTPIGVAGTGCAYEMDNALHFIGDDKKVYRFGEVAEKISDFGIDERIGQSTSVLAFVYKWQGHSFFCIRLSQGTWCIDAATQQWHERQTWGLANWIVGCAVSIDGEPLFGSAVGDDILEYDGWAEGASILSREFTAAFPIKGGSVPVDTLDIEANVGEAGNGITPRLEMRHSRDRGRTWSSWRNTNLGLQGEYRKRPRFRRLGYFDAPGGIFHFRLTDPSPLRISAVRINEGAAGRARAV